ncbi:hypothetical protein B7C51_24015 [Paenibacillus larvae subsp. pulvifaciens]|uniref:Uncharacterized protein n=1 Tax=Paenibacillus larvae subsp. pulvifaciens TaxID=1477 RepID=A0A1V0UZ07_9BACL|nr:hypothetical protein [Paenibacillus larvae]ARF70251.1 hypothetical protein B7C51_24015 [Paenibacillus larvae subsp. pulvifaciens]
MLIQIAGTVFSEAGLQVWSHTLWISFWGFRGNTPKVYVQHKIAEDKEKLIQLLDEDARLYIGGDGSRIAPDVEAAINKAYPEVHQTSRD